MSRSVSVACGLAALLVGTAAYAGRLQTPPVTRSGAADTDVRCAVTNASKKPIGPLTMTIYRANGTVAQSIPGIAVSPNESRIILALNGNLGITSAAFCVVEGKGVRKARTPATLCLTSAGNGNCLAATTVP